MSTVGSSFYDSESCHNATWYFAEEIFEFDWDQTIQRAGYVDRQFAHLFKDNPLGYPKKQMHDLQNPNPQKGKASITVGPAQSSADGVKVRWRETYRESSTYFLREVERFRQVKPPLSVRFVMWFGS